MGGQILGAIWVDKCVVGCALNMPKEYGKTGDKAGYFLHLTREYTFDTIVK